MKRTLRFRIGVLIIGIGALILLFPQGQRMVAEREQKKALVEAGAVIHRERGLREEAEEAQRERELTAEVKAFYEACAAYNEELFLSGQEDMTDLESVEDFPLRAADYGFKKEVVGILTVPRLNVELPLYLGASKEHMALGAALFGQTSVPMSESDHVLSAICAHRGFRGTPMFREIERMEVGDPIYITTPWEDLEYEVTETRVVLPNDTSWCHIEEGKNQVVLMTCHPYTKHTHRYLVFAERKASERD